MEINTTKEISPGLQLQAASDGVWLHFADSQKRHGSINLYLVFGDTSSISGKAIVQWAKDYALSEQKRLQAEA